MIQFENYFLLVLFLGISLAASYAYLRQEPLGNSKFKWVIGALRFSSLFLVLILLLSPILKCNKSKSIKPKIVLLVDNSKSIRKVQGLSFKEDVDILVKKLTSDKFDLETKIFDKSLKTLDSFNLNGKRTDLFSALTQTKAENIDNNLSRIVLVTDGNYNEGNNPIFIQNNQLTPVDVLLIGDTTRLSDLKVENIEYNKLMLQDEVNPLTIVVSAQALQNTDAIIELEEINGGRSKTISNNRFKISSNYFSQSIPFKLANLSRGKHFYRVSLKSSRKEVNLKNNVKEFSVEVIDGSKQIEIISSFPHPDLSAIKSWLQLNKNFKVKLNVSETNLTLSDNSDLIIFYQLPNQMNSGKALFDKAKLTGKSVLFILGTKTDYAAFNQLQNSYKINLKGNILQDYSARINPSFTKFYLNDQVSNTFQNYPPLSNYLFSIESKADASHLFLARMGRIESEQPLVSFAPQDNIQIGVIAAENIWKWRVNNYQSKKNFSETQDLFDKITNYLAIKKDKKQLTSYISSDYISEGDNLIISANTYNELYQPKKANSIKCVVNGGEIKNATFEMLPIENSYSLSPKNLKAGRYTYKVTAEIDRKIFSEEGSFLVYEDDIEETFIPSNYEDMNALALKSGGKLLMWKDRHSINLESDSKEMKEKLISETTRLKANDWVYLLLLILVLLSAEWLIRKYFGLN